MQFLSTPKLISDLLFVSDLLKTVEKDQRNYYLVEILNEINKNLPGNVYIPIKSTQLQFPDQGMLGTPRKGNKSKQTKYLNRLKGRSSQK